LWYDSRQMKRCISDEIADELRGELVGGRYRAGKALPSVDELRRRFGAGEFAVRAAFHKLRGEGLVAVKQHVGAFATEKACRSWKGSVAFVAMGQTAAYFQQMLSVRLARRFEEAGWRFSPIIIDAANDGSCDISPLVRHVERGLDFAVDYVGMGQVAAVYDKAGVPYAILNGYTRNFPNACAVIREDFGKCVLDLVKALHQRRIRRVLEFDYERAMDRGFKKVLLDAGIAIQSVMCKWENYGAWRLSDVKTCGYRSVAKYFSEERHRNNPPDVILFDDDYFAFGGIVAIVEAGFRIPQDVRIVSYSNKGNEPILGASVARIENDPVSYGDAVADYAIAVLEGRRARPPKIHWNFIPGESL